MMWADGSDERVLIVELSEGSSAEENDAAIEEAIDRMSFGLEPTE